MLLAITILDLVPKFTTDKNVPYHGMMYASYDYSRR